MSRYLFYSHDGYGLGHVRRNALIARAVLAADPDASVTLVTGLAARMPWLGHTPRLAVHRVPPLLKDKDGSYRHHTLSFEEAVARRARAVTALVREQRPDVVVVDRHPYGTAGELREGLAEARRSGAALVLGLRDVLDHPRIVAEELAGQGWADVPETFDEILVYGARHLVDHEVEYGLPRTPTYCGWVAERIPATRTDPGLLVVSAGGGGDGAAVFNLGAGILRHRPELRGLFAAGPYADHNDLRRACRRLDGRVEIATDADATGPLFGRAGAVLCMAGYNSTVEALAAGQRPILVPRRHPRREQAIRASRLAALGLVDVVDVGADAAEVSWLLGRDRRLRPWALREAGLSLTGAEKAATILTRLPVRATVRATVRAMSR